MGAPTGSASSHEALTAGLEAGPTVPRRHPGRFFASIVAALVLALLVHSVATNPNLHWGVFGRFLLNPDVLDGLLVTIELTVTAMAIGIAVGLLIALMRLSPNPLLARIATLYIAVFRGVPALVQLLLWYNLAALYPTIGLGLPFGITLFSLNANAVITPLVAANLGLGLCEGAYMAEIMRSGILSVDRGQHEAALACGMSRTQAMWRVVLPQALPVIVPPTGNQVIGMLKYTSLASVISVTELLTSTELIYTRTFETIPMLLVASTWYLVLTTVLTVLQRGIERRISRSDRDASARLRLMPGFLRGWG